MNTKDLVYRAGSQLATNQKGYATTRAKSFQVKTSSHDFVQYVKTVKAYALAGMSFEDIASAGDYLGDEVERKEIDAPLQKSWQNKIGEVAEDENKVLAWQNRGEQVPENYQLSSASVSTGREVVVISNELVVESNQDQMIDVLEGIEVERKEIVSLPEPTSNAELENNPYLKAPAVEFKKT